jgi:hypothetical protein
MVWMAKELAFDCMEKQEIFPSPQGPGKFAAHPAFCPTGMEAIFPGSKMAWGMLTTLNAKVKNT